MAVIALAAGKGHKRYYRPTLDHPQSLLYSQKVSSNQSKFDTQKELDRQDHQN